MSLVAPIVAFFIALPSFAFAADADGTITGIPTAGAPGVPRSVSTIMKEQIDLETAGLLRYEIKDQEEELQQPDRTHLPENPASPDQASFPGNAKGPQPESGGIEVFSPQTVGTNFTAATLSGTNPTLSFPPDCMGAVGPSQYFVFVNGRLVTFNKSTGVADGVINADPDVFFSSIINGSSTSDPRIRYDRLTGRWFLVIINVSTPNRILIAVSDAASGGTISGSTVFTFFFVDIATTPPAISSSCFADYPTLGVDNNALYIGTNNFCPSAFNSCDGFVIRKSSILGAGPIVVTVFRGLVASASAAGPFTPQGVDNYDPAATEGYFIGVDNATFGTLQMRRVATPGGTPTVSANIPITVSTTVFPENVPHLGNTGGTNGRLASLDDRLFAAHIRNHRLWTAHNIEVNASGVASTTGSRNGSRWYELNVPVGSGTPTIVQSGTIFDPAASNPNYLWIPSVMVSGQGHAAFALSRAGNNSRADAATVGRLSGDALGTTQTVTQYTTTGFAYNPPSDPGGSGGRRWGDYSYVSLDPLDDMSMWAVQMFCDATNSYGVRIAKLIAPPPATPASIPDVTAGVNPVNVTLTGTAVSGSGFYDPGANLSPPALPFNHLAVTITNGAATGTPPTVVSATYVSPTSVNLVLNASAATASIGAERYTVNVTNPDGQVTSAAILKVVGGTPTVSIAAGPVQNEGNAGNTTFNFTVNLSATTGVPVTVNYTTGDSTATVADNDYIASTSSIVIPANTPSGTIPISVKGDTKFENNEFFKVTLTGATNATLGSPVKSVGTITNDDATPTINIAPTFSKAEGNSGNTPFVIPVSLSNPSAFTVSATYGTSDGTAFLSDNDYVNTSGLVTFTPGTTSASAPVNVVGDTKNESNEAFNVGLSGATNGTIGTGNSTVTIVNDDVQPQVSISDVTLGEGNSGPTIFTFNLTLSEPSGLPSSVQWSTLENSATLANNDFVSASGTVNFAPGDAVEPVAITVNGDLTQESDETFFVNLNTPVGLDILDGQGVGTIMNDDNVPTVSIGDVSLAEGNAGTTAFNFAVTLSNPSDQPIVVHYHTVDGSATTADSDYQAKADSLTIPAKTPSGNIAILVNGDLCGEGDESFTVVIDSASGAATGDGSGAGTILNDDDTSPPSVTVTDPNGGESWGIGTSHSVKWTASDDTGIDHFQVYLSRDDGATFPELIASGAGDPDSASWVVTGPTTTLARVRVVVFDAGCNQAQDESNTAFQIFDPVSAVPGTGGVHELAIGAIHPNPTAGAATIEFAVPREGVVHVTVVDPQGREVARLVDGSYPPGRYQTGWDGTTSRGPAPMGVYFIVLDDNGKSVTKRLVLTR